MEVIGQSYYQQRRISQHIVRDEGIVDYGKGCSLGQIRRQIIVDNLL